MYLVSGSRAALCLHICCSPGRAVLTALCISVMQSRSLTDVLEPLLGAYARTTRKIHRRSRRGQSIVLVPPPCAGLATDGGIYNPERDDCRGREFQTTKFVVTVLFFFLALAQIPPTSSGRCVALGRGSRCRPAPLPSPPASTAAARAGAASDRESWCELQIQPQLCHVTCDLRLAAQPHGYE